MDRLNKINKVIRLLDDAANLLECLELTHLSEHIDSVTADLLAEASMSMGTFSAEVTK